MKKNNYLALCLLSGIFIFSTQAQEEGNEIDKLAVHIDEIERSIPVCKKDCIILLSDTGVGKSSLITYLANPSFVFAEQNVCCDYIIKATQDSPLTDIIISEGTRSGTSLPVNWEEYWDLPGFGETRGPIQEIVNAFSIYKAAINSTRIKILLLATDADIRQSKFSFLKLVQSVGETFKDEDNPKLAKSLCLVVTRNEKLNSDRTKNKLKSILEEQRGLSNFTSFQEKIIGALSSPEAKIVFFNAPQQAGNISVNDRTLILDAINQISYLENPQPSIHLSAEAMIYIIRLEQMFNRDIHEFISRNVRESIINHCNTLIKSHLGTVQSLRDCLSSFSTSLNRILPNTERLKDNLEIFLEITKYYLKDIKIQEELGKKIQRYRFLKLVDTRSWENPEYTKDWYEGILELIRHINKLSYSPTIDKYKSIFTLRGMLVGTSDLKVAMCEVNGTDEVDVYSLNSLFIDSDINLPGINLTLFSPYWRIIGEKRISLKGNDGDNHVNLIRNGNDGLPGLPGYSGGNFYGKGMDFVDLSSLTIDVSGGNGGSGQNGGDGIRGSDGQNGSLQSIENREESALKERKSIETESWGAYAESWAKFFLTFNGKFKETYETGTLGERGGDSGQGGIGGLGGNPGSVVIENQRSLRTVICSHGNRGADGKAGIPGAGGRNGERYRGVYINEVVAPGIRGYEETSLIQSGMVEGGAAAAGAIAAKKMATDIVMREGTKAIVKEGVKVAVREGGKEVAKEGGKVAIKVVGGEVIKEVVKKEVAKEVIKGVVRDVTVREGGKVVVQVGTSTVAGAAASLGISLAIQTVGSAVSSYLTSGWEDGHPMRLEDEPYAEAGIKPITLNGENIKEPALSNPIQQDEKKKSYKLYYSKTENIFKEPKF